MMAARFVRLAKWRVRKLVGNALKMAISAVFYTYISLCRPMIGKVASTTGGRDGVDRAKNTVEVMVLSDLAAICMKLAENSAVPVRLREQAGELVQEFEWLVPNRDKSDAAMHTRGENLLVRMVRFLPRILEPQPWPADSSNLEQ